MKLALILLSASATAMAALPSVGPDYARPAVEAPGSYRDAGAIGAWKSAAPADASARGEWWKLFADPTLDRLEALAIRQNQDLRATAARVEQAAASAGLARSAYWPQVGASPSAARGRSSATTANPYPDLLATDYSAPILATWEIDLFGRVRRLNESARADADASAETFESVRLSLTANVAADYFSMRGLDRELAILRDTVALRRRELELVSAQQRIGSGSELDTSRAETELAAAEAESAAVAVRRESAQDALAVLAGEAATSFSVPPSVAGTPLPAIPPGVPSDLLERRPDVAAAERSLAAANARIGVAKAAFFPAVSLTGGAGFESAGTDRLFGADSRIWSIGPSVYLPIFQGGRNVANLERSRAAYDESAAQYRQMVLVAFREVQEALTVARLLTEQSAAQDRALASSRRAAELARTRYDAGYVSYLDVVDAQRTELGNERAAAQLASLRLNTDVALIKALGGGWSGGASR
ncbi:MAG TPA: efflux transporter outer membrane subunit [Opitutaceae bacterium]|nr:efflux transporter outer membrane subunit [Opitutaceae bacterium]